MIPAGRPFFKMSGSGNDFVMVDARTEPRGILDDPAVIQRICARATGVGADGIVFLEQPAQTGESETGASDAADVRLTYLNADGTRADFCGNATLCTTRLSAELGAGDPGGMRILTDSGLVSARIRDGSPEIDLPPVSEVRASVPEIPLETGESAIGFALVGVPHLVIRCADVSLIDVVGRGRPLRSHPSLRAGANVNFVSHGSDGRWRYRTYERGVENETLACGSGSVASAILLASWGEEPGPIEDRGAGANSSSSNRRGSSGQWLIETRSGKLLRVTLRRDGDVWMPSLSGEGRIVFKGTLSEI